MAKESFFKRIKNAWNVFQNGQFLDYKKDDPVYASMHYKRRMSYGAEKTIINSIFTRIGIDVSSVSIKHVKIDENNRFSEALNTGLNRCLNFEANIDQTGRDLIEDITISMLDEGYVAVVPVDTDVDIASNTFDVLTLRTGKIVSWGPSMVTVELYDENDGTYKQIKVNKRTTAIIENPFYMLMNSPNSTLRRLIRKLSLMDTVDEETSNGKLDLIFQLPYVIKGDSKRAQADQRRQDIVDQLADSKYGIAYIDATEKVIQLNRSLDNNLLSQVQYLTDLVYSQLGLTTEILDGTANETTMLNYNNRVIQPILDSIVEEMRRKFLSQNNLDNNETIMYFTDPFKLVSMNNIAEIADKFTRNAILSSNEIRQIVGFKPSDDPDADVLRNKNLNQSEAEANKNNETDETNEGERQVQ